MLVVGATLGGNHSAKHAAKTLQQAQALELVRTKLVDPSVLSDLRLTGLYDQLRNA